MSREIRRYTFDPKVPMREVEETLLLAILSAEGLHGCGRVRLEAAYSLDDEKHACVIDVSTDVGRDVARIFTGFLIREFGEDAFEVKRVDKVPQHQTS